MAFVLGPTGPTGYQGPQGLQGKQGAVGPAFGPTGPGRFPAPPALYVITPTTTSFTLRSDTQVMYYNLNRLDPTNVPGSVTLTINLQTSTQFPVKEQSGMTWVFVTPPWKNSGAGYDVTYFNITFTGLFTGSYTLAAANASRLVMSVDDSGVDSYVFYQ
jgi:hypothetical protein